MNLYGYAGGDPINNSDPFGLCCLDPVTTAMVVMKAAPVVEAGAVAVAGAGVAGALAVANVAQAGANHLAAGINSMVGGARTLSNVALNYTKGKAFEVATAAKLELEGWKTALNVTLEAGSGERTVADILAFKDGQCLLIECKSSATARLTPNQRAAHPAIEATGATVMGAGKANAPGGTVVPPGTTTQVVRP